VKALALSVRALALDFSACDRPETRFAPPSYSWGQKFEHSVTE